MYHKRVKSENLWIGVTGIFTTDRMPFIDTISEIPVRVQDKRLHDRFSIPFGMGQIEVDPQVTLKFYGNPDNYDPHGIFRIKEPGMIGTIIMVDSTSPESFYQVRSMLETMRVYPQDFFPYVIALDKQDFPGAWSVGEVRYALQATEDEIFIPCVATNKDSVKNVLLVLLQQVLDSYEAVEV